MSKVVNIDGSSTPELKRAKQARIRAETDALMAEYARLAAAKQAAVVTKKPDPAEEAFQAINSAIQRNRQKQETWLPVSAVAFHFEVTPRRIRALLVAGRLSGRVQENGYWEVLFPYAFKFGTRGPQLRKFRPSKPELRAV